MHHYGRHGSHAWLRLHKRRFITLQPVVSLTTSLVIHVPVALETTERIIVIVMADFETDRNNIREPLAVDGHASVPQAQIQPAIDNEAKRDAELQASRYIENVVISFQKKQQLRPISQEEIKDTARTCALKFIDWYFQNKSRPTAQEDFRVRDLYRATFLDYSQTFIKSYNAENYFVTERNIRLHDAALDDLLKRKAEMPLDDDALNVLATATALLETRLTPHEALHHLKDIAPLIRIYKHYYQTIDPDKEVLWKDQETF
jgi:hypothetical protein